MAQFTAWTQCPTAIGILQGGVPRHLMHIKRRGGAERQQSGAGTIPAGIIRLERALITEGDAHLVALQAGARILPAIAGIGIDGIIGVDRIGDAGRDLRRDPLIIECIAVAQVEGVPGPLRIHLKVAGEVERIIKRVRILVVAEARRIPGVAETNRRRQRELVELELYLMSRARSMPIEAPAVRP